MLLALVQYFLGIKDPAGLTAALVPPHVLTEVLLSDYMTIYWPLVPHALVGQSSCWGGSEVRDRSSKLVFLGNMLQALNIK